ncbi:TniQ family protein [Hylemonella sp. W303a]|uniref:TniQ family protein n=1 Tax=Hylemonella sp. W303a TaxID=3389873 RepID=UPI00396B347F
MLVCPAPLPDELDRGYLGRVMRLNGVKIERDMQDHLYREFGLAQNGRYRRSTAEALSLMARMSTEHFVQRHTTMPLRRAMMIFCSNDSHVSLRRRAVLYNSAMRLIGPHAYFCAECAVADIAFHGMGYWRRSLQVPGRVFCEKHGAALMRAPSSALVDSPSRWIERAEKISDQVVNASLGHAAILRYLSMADELMDRTSSLPSRSIAAILLRRANLLPIQGNAECRVYRKRGTQVTCAIVQSTFPSIWLEHISCDFSRHGRDPIFSWLNVLENSDQCPAVWPFLLLGSALYEDTETAMHEWTSTLTTTAKPLPRTVTKMHRSQAANLHT